VPEESPRGSQGYFTQAVLLKDGGCGIQFSMFKNNQGKLQNNQNSQQTIRNTVCQIRDRITQRITSKKAAEYTTRK
jgi:hypothetical protein